MATAVEGRRQGGPGRGLRGGEVLACEGCGTVHRLPAMSDDTVATCTACGGQLALRYDDTVTRTLALYVAALCLVLVANAFPIMTMAIEGQSNAATILDSAKVLYVEGMWPLAVAVALAGIIMPLVKILGMIAVLTPLQLGLRPTWIVGAFRLVERVQTWAMMEVYLLGVIVAYVKMQDLATVTLGIAAIAFVLTILLVAAADARFDPHAIWLRLAKQADASVLEPQPGTVLVSCEQCEQVVRVPGDELHGLQCPRCGTPIHRRKPDSLNRTWALLRHRGDPLRPGQPAARPHRDLVRPGGTQHDPGRGGRADPGRHAAGGDPGAVCQHPRARPQADRPRLPADLGAAALDHPPARTAPSSTGSSRASGAGRWSTCS